MWLRVVMSMPVIVVSVLVMVVIFNRGTNVVHFVDASTLWAALDRTITGHSEPDSVMRVSRVTSAAKVSIDGMILVCKSIVMSQLDQE